MFGMPMNQQVRTCLENVLKTEHPKRSIHYVLYLIHFNQLEQAQEELTRYIKKFPEQEKVNCDLAKLLLQGRNNALPTGYKFLKEEAPGQESGSVHRYPDFAFCNRELPTQLH